MPFNQMKTKTMKTNKLTTYIGICVASLAFTACSIPARLQRTANKTVPERFSNVQDTANSAHINWHDFFTDPYLNALIDSALNNNQELNMVLQEINITRNEIKARKGEYLPFVNIGAGAGVDKVGRYTRNGALEATTDIKPGEEFPEPLPDFMLGANASWELDIWRKLRNGKKAATFKYLATVEGKNFLVTQLVAEIANAYYELLALDNRLEIVNRNIDIQTQALRIVKLQKSAAKVTELAVKKFEAEVLKNRSLRYYIQQEITETENEINFLVGRFPQPVKRTPSAFSNLMPQAVLTGLPAQMLENRPDIKQAELELEAAKLDVKIAKAQFYPSLGISAGIGLQAFNPEFLTQTPQSLMYALAGDLIGPLINRNAIKAAYKNANSQQIQAVINYERTLLNAYIEVANQLSKIDNLSKSYDLKEQQVEALTRSIDISTGLFQSARADYMEVLLTQRDALEAKIEMIETKQQQMHAMVDMYQALGGGWK